MTNRTGDNLIHFGGNQPLVQALAHEGVKFLVIGGLAISWHCPERVADDMDLLLDPSPDNAEKVVQALMRVNMQVASGELLAQLGQQLRFKGGSLYAELLTPKPGGITYAEAEVNSVAGRLFHIPVRIASVASLMRMKKDAAATTEGTERKKHLDDLKRLGEVSQ